MATRFAPANRVRLATVAKNMNSGPSDASRESGRDANRPPDQRKGGRMPAHKAAPIELSSEHERDLNALVRAHSTPQKLAERARIVLLAATGLGVGETARRL